MRTRSGEEQLGQAQRVSYGARGIGLRRSGEVKRCKDQWEAGVWHMDKEQWHLLWPGEQDFWKTVQRLLASGHCTAEGLTEP
jgi:hypothetical protein